MRPAWTPRHQVAAGAVTPVGPHDGGHGRAAAGTGAHLQAAADEFGAFGHAPQSVRPSEAPGPGGPRRRSRSRRRHAQERVPAVAGQLDLDPAGLRVPDNVLQRLPGGAVQRDLRVLGNRHSAASTQISSCPIERAKLVSPSARPRSSRTGGRRPAMALFVQGQVGQFPGPSQFATAASLPVAAAPAAPRHRPDRARPTRRRPSVVPAPGEAVPPADRCAAGRRTGSGSATSRAPHPAAP